jgi:hypothetical protein
MAFHDLAREYSATTGTSNAVLSGAVVGCNTWDDAGVTNGESVKYAITTYSSSSYRVVVDREVGTGTYTTSSKTVARTTVISSTNGGSKITMTGFSQVYICPSKDDMDSWTAGGGGGGGGSFALLSANYVDTSLNNNDDNITLRLDTELIDDDSLITLASNIATVATDGWYRVDALVTVTINTGSNVTGNGYIQFLLTNSGDFDNSLMKYVTVSGQNYTGIDFPVSGTVLMASSGAKNHFHITMYDHTGHALTAYIHELLVRQL